MDTKKQLNYLINKLVSENFAGSILAGEGVKDIDDPEEMKTVFRTLVNVRPPMPIRDDFLEVQNEYLKNEIKSRGIVTINDLDEVTSGIYLWQGDITRLAVDGIVNAANSKLLGCFIPCHGCIDNAIHTYAGVQLRLKCNEIMEEQGHDEPTGSARITEAYNLPGKYVLHTVGPVIAGSLTTRDRDLLKSCYRSCLELACENSLTSIAFCCISTGEYHFPNDTAAEIAVHTVMDFLKGKDSKLKVIFNVFKEKDYQIYRRLLG